MVIILTLLGYLLALIGMLTSIFSEETRDFVVTNFGVVRRRLGRMSGTWDAVYSIPDGTYQGEWTEKLFVRQLGKSVVVRIDNSTGRIRARGKIENEQYFTGRWQHNKDGSVYHGAFQLLLSPDGDSVDGLWIGFSGTGGVVRSGTWKWVRSNHN